mmetsp:Transcript_37047/g.51096  ORF Transcript_37047/g.51096 Transcript_37047/m.51096 type:complete len:164 (+) Transcript_37047:41-532(+)|eukprot:CAMPEP_0201477858 /NCGR_PEP_ID=MMETSP0151_2-20130828/2811_1 /ASSEMBLY_ACC=CAM_ASM_000257 /TAXON_ID=200890 /ORGANISM="Paramoeba atlantica, Strain 621/1 / CCAP 1560/9" /LENGTH=163 /DNA_ID=CAMNT_0047858721 /DNA_START=12 /DNA_END=503 /DNA_ORIENTATION=-
MASGSELIELIDASKATCLNESEDHPFVPGMLTNSSYSGKLESDADEELLIFIPFKQLVRLTGIAIRGPLDQGPATVKLFAGQRGFNFDDAKHFKPSQLLKLGPAELDGKKVDLELSQFQKMDCLTIFVESNQSDDDVSSLNSISLIGFPHGSLNMKELKKVG